MAGSMDWQSQTSVLEGQDMMIREYFLTKFSGVFISYYMPVTVLAQGISSRMKQIVHDMYNLLQKQADDKQVDNLYNVPDG